LEDILLESLALSSIESVSTITGDVEQNLLGCSDTDIEVIETEATHTRPSSPRPQLIKLSGAARQKRRLVAAQAEGGQTTGEASSATPRQDQPCDPLTPPGRHLPLLVSHRPKL